MKGIGAVLLLSTLATSVTAEDAHVFLEVSGSPIAASDTENPGIYNQPAPRGGPKPAASEAGIIAQGWSMLGREDLAAQTGSNEYEARPCARRSNFPIGLDAVLEEIARQAAQTRIVILNESHEVAYHRDFSRRLIERLRVLGYSVLAAEAFSNFNDKIDPVTENAKLPYPTANEGWYLQEPVFGGLVRSAKRLGYRLAAYEQAFDNRRDLANDAVLNIAWREDAQARHLANIFASIKPDEKLIVHAGYSHASERISRRGFDNLDTSMMAARLPELTGVNPLTIAQTECRGSGSQTQVSIGPKRIEGRFDMIVDHPTFEFRFGRPQWRFENGNRAIEIPQELRPVDAPLVIEAFVKGEPFDAVPIDRAWVDPGEDVRLALPPGRYTVRAVIPTLAAPPATP